MSHTPFEEDVPQDVVQIAFDFRVDLEGFEGPIDLLLHLARQQKVDLKQISILSLAEQYLQFIAEMRVRNLEVAADYLVMAAWLAYLKSRLLLPEPELAEEEISPQDMEAALAIQLQRLQAMQKAGKELMQLPHLNADVFRRPESSQEVKVVYENVFSTSLFDLLRAYADITRKSQTQEFRIPPSSLFSVEACVERLRKIFGHQLVPSWQNLFDFLPTKIKSPMERRSAMASTFVASLDLARYGTIDLQQESTYGTIFVRTRPQEAANSNEVQE